MQPHLNGASRAGRVQCKSLWHNAFLGRGALAQFVLTRHPRWLDPLTHPTGEQNGRRCRRHQNDQGQRGQVRRPSFYRHAGQGATRLGPGQGVRRQQVHRRPRFRRLVDRRLERHPSLRHAADARSRFRAHRPVHRRADADPHVRRGRALRRQRLRPRPALDREARRSLSQVDAASATPPTSVPSPSSSFSTR